MEVKNLYTNIHEISCNVIKILSLNMISTIVEDDNDVLNNIRYRVNNDHKNISF